MIKFISGRDVESYKFHMIPMQMDVNEKMQKGDLNAFINDKLKKADDFIYNSIDKSEKEQAQDKNKAQSEIACLYSCVKQALDKRSFWTKLFHPFRTMRENNSFKSLVTNYKTMFEVNDYYIKNFNELLTSDPIKDTAFVLNNESMATYEKQGDDLAFRESIEFPNKEPVEEVKQKKTVKFSEKTKEEFGILKAEEKYSQKSKTEKTIDLNDLE